MPVSDPAAVRFANETVRPLADTYALLYYQIVAARDAYLALGMATKFPVGGGEVMDGAAADGRPVITSDDIRLFSTRMNEMITDLEAASKVKLNSVIKLAVRVR